MIICICNRINEHGVRRAAHEGANNPCAVYAAHDCAMKCGRCIPAMNEILSDTAAKRRETGAGSGANANILAAE